jgi:hypothetical protein
MATTTASAGFRDLGDRARRPLGGAATAALLTVLCLAVTTHLPAPGVVSVAAVIVVLGATALMLFSEKYGWSLVVLMLYLGLADGYLKLSTGSQPVTLVRDLLLYAIVAGALVRAIVRKESMPLPPLAGWVIAWIVVVLVQIANPDNGTLTHSIASVRPHLEFVPLFFLGYLVMRSKATLRNFLLLLLVVAAINGIVGLIQLNESPSQLASWGPGYAKAINGEGTVSARGFVDESGEEKNRPFALGGDSGFGGSVGVIAIPAGLALLGLASTPGRRFAVAALLGGAALAVITSEARVSVLSAVVAVFAYAGLVLVARVGVKTLVAITLGLAVGILAIGLIVANTQEGSFSRYESISNPKEAVTTAYEYRGGVIAQVPKYAVEIPFGAGFGSRGPAGSFGGGGSSELNGESEPTYLLIEVGVPGLLVLLGFNLVLFFLSLTRIRLVPDRETRIMLAAVAAPLFAIFASWFAGVATAGSPGAPYLWFAAGLLSFWLLGRRRWSSA